MAAPERAVASTPLAPLGPGMAALTLALLLGLQPIATDLVLPALPALATDLNASMPTVQLTMSALILAFGLAQLVWGPVADRVGRRPVLLAALALFALATVGATLANQVAQVVGWRVAQGASLAAVVVCGRAMVRDLYEPVEGAMVMARALGGLGLIAISSPVLGGLLVATWGWRASLAAMGVIAAIVGLFVFWRVPESRRPPPVTTSFPAPLWRQAGAVLRHPGFRAWTLLVACSYGGIFTFLAASGFVLIGQLGLSPAAAGLWMATPSTAYIVGTLICRRWIPVLGLASAARRASWFSLAAALGMLLTAIFEWNHAPLVMAPMWLYGLGHGVINPCGQTGAMAAFPRAAGLAAAMSGFMAAAAAFAIGLWLGQALDPGAGQVMRVFAATIAACALAVFALAHTLVHRDGGRLQAG